MRIIGFGDSFITETDLDYTYTNRLATKYNADIKLHGIPGSGTWEAYFQFMEHFDNQDIVMFVWSNSSRLYHHRLKDICFTGAERNKDSDDPAWQAANMYYQYLFDERKTSLELTAFYYWFDDYISQFKNTKFIHMWSFPASKLNAEYYTWDEHEKYDYLHRFKTGMEVRPALVYLSYLDGWPTDLSNETRIHHMTPKMHSHLMSNIIDSLEAYENGKAINITL